MSVLRPLVPLSLALLALCVLAAAPALAAPLPGTVLWTEYGARTASSDSFFDAASCPGGGVVAVGITNWSAAGTADALVCKYAADGSLKWAHTFDAGEGREDAFSQVAVDRFGNVIAAGWTNASATDADYLIVKYDKNGVRKWDREIDGGFADSDSIGALVLDPAGNACVTGSSVTLAGQSRLLTIRLRSADGDALFTRTWRGPTGTAGVNGWGLAAGRDGTLRVTGSVYSTSSVERLFLLKLSDSGKPRWAGTYLPKGSSRTYGVATQVGRDGIAYVLGSDERSSGGMTSVLLRYSGAGALKSTSSYATAKGTVNRAVGLAVDRAGDLFACGQSAPVSGTGSRGFVVRWNAAGKRRWANLYPAGDSVTYRDIVADGKGGAFVSGQVKVTSSGDTLGLVRHVGAAGKAAWNKVSPHAGGNDSFNALALCGTAGVAAAGRYMYAPGDEDAIIQARQR